MPKVSEEHLDARRRQILDAAVACFARDGFHRATMQDICREAKLSPGAIYRYFTSKNELIEAIADVRHAREAEFAAGALDIGEGAEALHALGRAFLRSLDDPDERRRRKLGVQVWAEALLNPEIHKLVMRGIELPLTVIPQLVRQAQEKGQIDRGLDPDALARVMLAMFQGFILQQAWDERVDVLAYLETAEAFIDALLAEPAR